MTPKEESAVAIAQDVLDTIEELIVRRQYYVNGSFGDDRPLPEKSTQLQEILPQVKQYCTVCALGSLFLSHIKFHNNLTIQSCILGNSIYLEGPLIKQLLLNHFDEEDIYKIESFFERQVSTLYFGSDFINREDIDYRPIALQGRKYPDPKKNLRTILVNIIENEGHFRPETINPLT